MKHVELAIVGSGLASARALCAVRAFREAGGGRAAIGAPALSGSGR
jgi:hypothetical protein